MVFTRPLTFKSSSPYTHPLVNVQDSAIKIYIAITFMAHASSVLEQNYLFLYFPSGLPSDQSERQSPLFDRLSFFWLSLGLVLLSN